MRANVLKWFLFELFDLSIYTLLFQILVSCLLWGAHCAFYVALHFIALSFYDSADGKVAREHVEQETVKWVCEVHVLIVFAVPVFYQPVCLETAGFLRLFVQVQLLQGSFDEGVFDAALLPWQSGTWKSIVKNDDNYLVDQYLHHLSI